MLIVTMHSLFEYRVYLESFAQMVLVVSLKTRKVENLQNTLECCRHDAREIERVGRRDVPLIVISEVFPDH